jgi:hypothetical protein
VQRRGESPAGGGSWNIDLGSFHWAMPPPTYGSWGAVAGRPGEAANPGNAPCIGAGLMNKLAKRFVVALTPEHHTSKTCCKCLRPCGPWAELEDKMGRKIRGVRVCAKDGVHARRPPPQS